MDASFIVDATRIDAHLLSLLIGHDSHEVTLATDAIGQTTATVGGVPVPAALNSRRRWGKKDAGGASGSGPQRLTAPMPGKVVRVLVKPGDTVTARQPLVVIEAMKMENELRAARDGVVAEVQAREGQSVDAGMLLLVVACRRVELGPSESMEESTNPQDPRDAATESAAPDGRATRKRGGPIRALLRWTRRRAVGRCRDSGGLTRDVVHDRSRPGTAGARRAWRDSVSSNARSTSGRCI